MSAAQLAFEFPRRPAMERDDFMVAESNRAAVAWLDRWPDWPAPVLAIHGPPGCGKTHLAQVWRARVAGAGEPAPLIAPDDLAAAAPAELLAGARCCVVEDAERAVCGAPEREVALFHLYNHLAAAGGQMLLTGQAPPARWPIGLADLRSRLAAAPAAALGAPDDALVAAVLVKLFADRQLRVGVEVIDYLLTRMERSFAAAHKTVAALDGAALAGRRNITVPLARQVLDGNPVANE